MGQPHLPRIRLFTELCRLLEHHMLILPRVGNFFLLTVHALADKEVIVRGIFGDCRNRARVSRVGNGNSAALFSQHHVRGQDLTLVLDGLAFLQSAPEFLRNLLGSRPFHIKFAVSRDRNAISIAGHAVVYAECVHHIGTRLKFFSRLREFFKHKWERKFRRNGAQGTNDTFQTFRSHQKYRLRALRVSHGQEKPRKSADMVGMVVGEADHVHRLRAPSLFFQCDLGSLAAVDQQIAAIAARHHGR